MASNESSGSGTTPNPSGSGSLPRGLLSLRGTPVSKDTRLSSLRGARDLTLGGVRKKTFQPNIPARRNKDENKESKDVPAETPASAGHQPGHGKKDDRSRVKGHGRARADVIQSHSIFEEGPSKTEKCKVSREPVERGYTSGSKPQCGLKHEIKSHDQDTKAALDSLLQDNFVVHEKLNDSDPAMCPVQLPVTSSLKKENKVNIKKIPKVKEELKDEDETMIDKDQRTALSSDLHHVTPEASRPLTAAGLFSKATKSEQPQFIFIQLPDTLPGEPSTDDVQPSKKHTETEPQKPQDKCTLADFHEGLIGKLCIHKSGRTTLRLGNTRLDVRLGTYPGFLQDVVSLRVDGDSGNLTVLGHVPHKVVCIPDFEAMIPET